ncbi:Mitochondrial distribution and morphology protein 10 [Saitoella coloradoensis]
MYGFMDYLLRSFNKETGWNHQNLYSDLTGTSRALLDFVHPLGLHFHISSYPSQSFMSSYTLSTLPVLDGSMAYLCTTRPLSSITHTKHVPLHEMIEGYREPPELQKHPEPWEWEVWQNGKRVDKKDSLLYGRMYIPSSTLEAMYTRRIAPTKQLILACVSDTKLPNGGTITAEIQHDVGKWSTEYVYSTEGGMLGLRGLWNFGPDPRKSQTPRSPSALSGIHDTPPVPSGRLSAGAEIYYGALTKSAGMSLGLRYASFASTSQTPRTMTLTWNPIMGSVSTTYAVKNALTNSAFCSRFDFNMFSYESNLALGCEIWQWRDGSLTTSTASGMEKNDDDVRGVFKAQVGNSLGIGLQWEGRFKDFLFSLGTVLDLTNKTSPVRSVGLELQYSS